MGRVLVSAAALLALAACGKKGEAGRAPDATSAAAPTAASAPAAPLTPPTRKVGLWEQKMTTGKMSQISRICFSDAVNKQMTFWGEKGSQTECSQRSITPIPGGWTFSSTCDLGSSGRVVSSGEAKGDFGTHYVVNIKSTTTGATAPQMNGDHQMALEATWKGPCPPDFKPGDMEISGMKINMLTMSASGPGAGGRPSPAQIAAMRKAMAEAQKANR